MMKVPQGGNLNGAANLYDLWTSDITVEADTDYALDVHPGTTYKSPDVLSWDNLTIGQVNYIAPPPSSLLPQHTCSSR